MNFKILSLACACFGALAPSAPAALVAHWDFNEGSGPAAVDSVAGISGQLQGNAAWTEGRNGNAVRFQQDATSQVYVGTPEVLNLTGAVSVAAWVRPDGISNYGVIAGIDKSGGATSDQFVLKTTVSGTSYLSFQITDTAGKAVTATDSVSIVDRADASEDGWVHVAAVFNPGESVSLYVNGSQVARTATTVSQMQSMLSESVPFRIGNMSSSTNFGFNGAIDEVRIYDNALDASAIAALAAIDGNGGNGGAQGEYLFSFGAVADPQYKDAATSGSRHYRKTLEKLPVMVADFNARDLEFVISLGDFIDAGFESFTPMLQIWNQLTHPSYQLIGNHDLSVGSYTLADVVNVLGMPSNYYSFAVNGWRFLVLDGNDAGYGLHSAAQLGWARDQLDQALADGEPVIIFDHYPIYPAGTPHITPQASQLLALIAEYPNVRAWMNGHNHAGAYGMTGGVHYLNMQGMVETENTTAYAEIQIWSDRIEVLGVGREPSRTLLLPVAPAVTLDAPTGVVASDGVTGIRVSWDAYTGSGADQLVLERRVAGSADAYEVVATLGLSETTFLDLGARSGATSVYRLRAVDSQGNAAAGVAQTRYELGFLETKIADLTATGGEDNSIALSWNLDGVSYDRLVLERRLGDSGEFILVSDSLEGNATTYTDINLAPNTAYTYRIAGVSGQRQAQWSDVGSGTSGVLGELEGEAPGLVAYWPFNEGTGNIAADVSGNGASGTLVSDAVWTGGKFGGALTFGGDSDDQVLVGTPEVLNISGAVTVMAWVKPDGTSNYGVIAGIDNGGGTTDDQYVLKTTVRSSFQLRFQVTANGSGYHTTDPESLTTRAAQSEGGWVHVAGVFTPGKSVDLYVNGELVASTPVEIEEMQRTLSTSFPFRIGNMSGSSNYGFSGAIDEVRVFAASVAPVDIAAYATGEPVEQPAGTLIERGAVWKYLDDGSDQGAAWRATDFDDASWASGAAQLGYGDGDEVTVLNYGGNASNKYPTYYFRNSFTLSEAALSKIEQLRFDVLRDDGVVVYINGEEVVRDNMPAGEINYLTYAPVAVDGENEKIFYEFKVSPEHLRAGKNVIAVEVHQQRASSSDVSFDLGLEALSADQVVAEDVVVIDTGYIWKYLDDGSDQGTAWSAVGFNDNSWASGPSQLGYGDGDEATVIGFGGNSSNKYPTYYFRTTFEVEDASDYIGMLFEVLRDDGVILYLNGHEIIRDNMPATGVNYLTYSSTTVDGAAERTFYQFPLRAEHLVDGTNVLAAEVHNRSASSSDISFDLKLTLQAAPNPNAPVFSDDTIVATTAIITEGYTFDLSDYVTDANGDALVFTKISGPDWITVAPDGTVSGTPSVGDIGLNEIIVSVTDNTHGTVTAVIQIRVEEAPELARAPFPGGQSALRFGIVPDTQGSTNGVPTTETLAVTEQLLLQQPQFAIHVGDVTDGNRTGDAKMVELNYFNSLMTDPLREAGILLYPIRGNHDAQVHTLTSGGIPVWQAAFPHLFSGQTAVVNPANVPGGTTASPNGNNYSYVFNPAPGVYLIALDMWQGGSNSNYSNWVAAQMAAIRANEPDAHIFGYSHSGLFSSSSHPAMTEYIGSPTEFIAAGKAHGIDGWFSGHNHIFDRSMAIASAEDEVPVFFNITVGSASSKFYGISRSPVADQRLNRVIDSTRIDGRPIAYQMVEINGSFVTVTTYMSPKNASGGFSDWSVWDELTYSRTGEQFIVAPGANYSDSAIFAAAPQGDAYIGTTVQVIDGVNSDTTVHTYGSNSFGEYRNVSVGWWSREDWHQDSSRQIVSDVASIHGMRNTAERNRADAYTLVMGFDANLSPLHRSNLSIVAFLDADTADSNPGNWVDAVEATLGTAGTAPLMRAPLPTDAVGTWGIDLENNQVWARLDYQGDFAIASNVIDTDNDGLADEWEMLHFGTLAYGPLDDPDGDGLNNLLEQLLGTNPTLADTDGDLIPDGIEYANGLDPLSPNTELTTAILDAVRGNPQLQHSLGLYTRDALGALSGYPLIDLSAPGEATLRLRIEESTDLQTWSEISDEVILTVPVTGDKKFFRFIAR